MTLIEFFENQKHLLSLFVAQMRTAQQTLPSLYETELSKEAWLYEFESFCRKYHSFLDKT